MSASRRPTDAGRPASHVVPDPFALPFGLGAPDLRMTFSALGGGRPEDEGHGYRLTGNPNGGAAPGGSSKGGGSGKNFAPKAVNDSATTDEATPLRLAVLANDSDRNGDALAITHLNGQAVTASGSITLASGAIVRLNADQTLSYDQGSVFTALNWGQSALDTFTYRISDGRGGTAQATVSVTVTGIGEETQNRAPVAANDTATTDEATVRTGNVLANDSDPDGDALHVSAVNGTATSVNKAITLASGATFTLRDDGSYSYDPNGAFDALLTGQTATDRVNYTVSDGKGGTATASLTVSIAGIGTAPVSAAPAYYVEDLLLSSSQRWNASSPYGTAATVSFTFLDSVPSYYASGDWAYNSFRSFSTTQREVVRKQLDTLETFTNLSFVETGSASTAAITFGFADIPNYTGYAYYPSGSGEGRRAGDVWLDVNYTSAAFRAGSFDLMLLLHEIGHAVGLDHVGSLTGAENTRMYTVMSYNGHAGGAGEPSSYMPYDIATLQYIYGANMQTATGNNVYRFADLAGTVKTIWDAGGTDTFDMSAATTGVKLDLRPGSFSTVGSSGQNNIAIAHGTVIENAIGGAGNDIIIGNSANNRLDGGAGADLFRFFDNWGHDVIGDFMRGQDKLDLTPAGYGYADLDFGFMADRAVITAGGNSITLLGVTTLSQSDFVLFG